MKSLVEYLNNWNFRLFGYICLHVCNIFSKFSHQPCPLTLHTPHWPAELLSFLPRIPPTFNCVYLRKNYIKWIVKRSLCNYCITKPLKFEKSKWNMSWRKIFFAGTVKTNYEIVVNNTLSTAIYRTKNFFTQN